MANSIDYVITVNDTQAKSTINSLISDIKKLDTAINSCGASLDSLVSKFNKLSISLPGSQLTSITNNYNTLINQTAILNTQTNNLTASFGQLQGGNLATSITGIASASDLAAKGIGALKSVLAEITTTGRDFESIHAQFKAIFVTTENVNSQFGVLLELSQKTGQSILTLSENYARFSASAKFSGESESNIQKIFSNLSEVAQVMHMSNDKQKQVFNSIEQMYSKNQVMSEELKRQLGNSLPGAVSIFARSLDVTTPKLLEMMKAGEVLPKETILGFTELLHSLYATQDALDASSSGFQAAMGRWDTATSLASAALYEQLKPAIIGTIETGVELVNLLREGFESLDKPLINVEGRLYSVKTVMKSFLQGQKDDFKEFVGFFEKVSSLINAPRSMRPVNLSAEFAAINKQLPQTSIASYSAAQEKEKQDSLNKKKITEAIALANQKALLSEKTAGETELTDKQIAKFIAKEGMIAKAIISDIAQDAKSQLSILAIESDKLDNKYKERQLTIKQYYAERIKLAEQEHQIKANAIELEKKVLIAEQENVNRYKDIQLDNTKESGKLNATVDKYTNYATALSQGYAVNETGTVKQQQAAKELRDKSALEGRPRYSEVPLVISSVELTKMAAEIQRLRELQEERKKDIEYGIKSTRTDVATAPKNRAEVYDYAKEKATSAGLDWGFVSRLIKQESGFNPNARSPVGAMGVMQMMPGTFKQYSSGDPWNYKDNIDAGIKMLSRLFKKFGDDASVAAAYNGGDGAVRLYKNEKYKGYAETRNYVKVITGSSDVANTPNAKVTLPNFSKKDTNSLIDTKSKDAELDIKLKQKENELQNENNNLLRTKQKLVFEQSSAEKEFLNSLNTINADYRKSLGENMSVYDYEASQKEKVVQLQKELLEASDSEKVNRIATALRELDAMKEQVKLRATMDKLQKQEGTVKGLGSLATSAIANDSGLTEFDKIYQKSSVAKDLLPQMTENYKSQTEAINTDKSLSFEEKALKIGELTQKISALKKESEGVSEFFSGKLTESISTSFNAWISGTKSAKESLADFGISVAKTLQKILVDELSMQATKGITSLLGSVFSSATGGMSSGGLVGYAGGGITGTGTGLSDGITANIPNGSYIMSASSTANIGRSTLAKIANGEFLFTPPLPAPVSVMDRINKSGVLGFADGGFVGSPVGQASYSPPHGGNGSGAIINITNNGGKENNEPLAMEVVRQIARHEAQKAARISTKKR